MYIGIYYVSVLYDNNNENRVYNRDDDDRDCDDAHDETNAMSRSKNLFLLAQKKMKPTTSAVVVESVEIVIIAVRPCPVQTDRLQYHIIYIGTSGTYNNICYNCIVTSLIVTSLFSLSPKVRPRYCLLLCTHNNIICFIIFVSHHDPSPYYNHIKHNTHNVIVEIDFVPIYFNR